MHTHVYTALHARAADGDFSPPPHLSLLPPIYFPLLLPLLSQWELRDYAWPDVVERLKDAQKEHKMNIRKQELTELGQPNLPYGLIPRPHVRCVFTIYA